MKNQTLNAERVSVASTGLVRLLRVVERPLLTNGGITTDQDGAITILIAADQSREEKLITLWHEIVHLMRMAGGYSQDEAGVEDAAQRLATACPEALEWVGIPRPPLGNWNGDVWTPFLPNAIGEATPPEPR